MFCIAVVFAGVYECFVLFTGAGLVPWEINMYRRVRVGVGLTVLSIAGATSGRDFDFVNITDGPLGPGLGRTPSINDNGDIAFMAGSELYFYDSSAGTFLNVSSLAGAPASAIFPKLNNLGDIAVINNTNGNVWLFEVATQSFTNISLLPGHPGNSKSFDLKTSFDLNDARQLSLHSGDRNFGEIYVYEHASGLFTKVTDMPGGPTAGRDNAINNNGQIAFSGFPDDYIFDIAGGTTQNITDLPGGPGTGLGGMSFNDNGDVAIMLQAGNDPVIFDATSSTFLSLATLPGFPAGLASSNGDDLSARGDFTFWRTEIHHFDPLTQAFTQLTNRPGETPAGGRNSSVNRVGVIAFAAGFDGVEDIFVATPTCPADFDGDGAVAASDLAQLLGGWTDDVVFADLDGNGEVGSADLAFLLGAWGVCP